MGSSRRFGGTSDSRLQKILGHRDSFDPTLKGTMTRGDRSTRFDMDDYDPRDEARIRQDIDQKQGVSDFFDFDHHSSMTLDRFTLGTIETLARSFEQVGNICYTFRTR